jgi:hypothetical protein
MIIESQKSCNVLTERHGNILSTIEIPCIKHNLLTYINHYGSLYSGTLIPTEFQKTINSDKSYTLSVLKQINNSNEIIPDIQRVWFYLHMVRECIKHPWRWPAIANEIDGKLYFYTGLGRLLATGMCQPEPWTMVNVLLFCPNNISNTHKLFENLQRIETDSQLHQTLNLEYSADYNPYINPELHLKFQHDDSNRLILKQMYDGNSNHHYDAGKEYLNELIECNHVHRDRPTLKVYTDWPEKIFDSQQAWNIVHSGASLGNKIKENLLYNQFNDLDSNDHIFYVTTPRKIDVSELLSWVNLKSTSYISINWEFALITPGKEYRSFLFD